ncbi:hypothetical protein [Sporomusa sphaeroides]|uniref:Uncharacterized protein n=1 Tax=Sporomusa sphaeroides DSM 2875 TaxID=1337886 RepID=A0A1U7MA07_9FIRM|nr:hypothetical protein [Sporomusa sphaeroides]OLS54338.1 hypothetical protein SPSPH_45840 [Sporomusa sphaeroides DSM 2875]CVK21567.1 hypothetical protein SSPH_04259 [Sporomusa sphaeroides DSM 2875]
MTNALAQVLLGSYILASIIGLLYIGVDNYIYKINSLLMNNLPMLDSFALISYLSIGLLLCILAFVPIRRGK